MAGSRPGPEEGREAAERVPVQGRSSPTAHLAPSRIPLSRTSTWPMAPQVTLATRTRALNHHLCLSHHLPLAGAGGGGQDSCL